MFKTGKILVLIFVFLNSSALAQEVVSDSIMVEVWVANNLKNVIIGREGKEISYETGKDRFLWLKNSKGSIEFIFLINERNKDLIKSYLAEINLKGIAFCCVVRDSSEVIKAVYPLSLVFPGKLPAKWVNEIPYGYSCFYLNKEGKEIIEEENIFLAEKKESY